MSVTLAWSYQHGLPRVWRRQFGSGSAELQAAAAWASPSARASATRCCRFGAPQRRPWLRRLNLHPRAHPSPARGDTAAAGPLAKPRDGEGEGAGVMAGAREVGSSPTCFSSRRCGVRRGGRAGAVRPFSLASELGGSRDPGKVRSSIRKADPSPSRPS
jgi:hypothetical protein